MTPTGRLGTNAETRFGRYELLEQVGTGGMGEVYRARDRDLHRDVAIKFLPAQFASDPERLARFAQEARTASSLNHPNIVTIHEIGQTRGRAYIVMEFVDGKTLRAMLRPGRPLPAKQMLDIGVQLGDGLAKAHAARIVHRDLKPENVMVTKDGFVKILDFGLAKLRTDADDAFGVGAGLDATSDTATGLTPDTAVGVVLGTASYMAPEQARGLPADHRSDQFALGAILYEMATGARAFHRESVVQTLSAIIETNPRPIAEINPSFPAPARWAIERCLAKDPADRYASTLDLAHELRGIRERSSDTSISGTGVTVGAPALRRSRLLRVAIGIAAILAVVFLAPAIRDGLSRWKSASLTDEMRLAVLLNDADLPAPDRDRLRGLLDYIVIRLADLNRFRESFSVVPSSEVREAMVRSPGDAKRRVGANYAMSLTMRRADRAFVVSASLEDTDRLRVVGGDQRSFSDDQFSQENVVEMIVAILRVQLASSEHRAWTVGVSTVAEARALFAHGLTQTPYQTARTALERYDQEQSLQKAIDGFNRAIELDSRYADAYARLGEAYLLLYRLTARPELIALAEQNATKARDLDDTRPYIWVTLGMIHAQKGAYTQAEQEFADAIARGPRTSLAYRELARAQQQRDPDKAEANFRKAIELDPEGWSNYSYLGAFLVSKNRLAEAEQIWLSATRKSPDNPRVWSNLGGLYYLQNRFDDAERALNQATQLGEYGPALSNLGTIKFRVRRQYADAAKLFERAVGVAPRDYRLWQNLAAAYYWTPDARERATAPLQNAIGLIEETRQIEPDSPQLLADLADAYAMLRDGQGARPLIARAVKLAPSDPGVALVAASVYEMLGDRDIALQYVASALHEGTNPFEFESDPTFAVLVKDPRYAKLTKRQ
jgi:serine/threonine protein kinase/tetratricopeptide (TPR) repeat protein